LIDLQRLRERESKERVVAFWEPQPAAGVQHVFLAIDVALGGLTLASF